jgi:FkbM family methyltransferase
VRVKFASAPASLYSGLRSRWQRILSRPTASESMVSVLSTLQFIARHPLSSKRRLSAYLRYARWQIESRLRDEVVFNWVEGSKLVARNGMTGATGNIYCGLHEFVDMAFLLHLLRPGDLFVDVGANIGSYTVLASAVCGARSIAIEPDPGTSRSLKRNIERNGIDGLVTVIEAAVGAAPGMVRFTIGRDSTNRVAVETDAMTREVEVRTLDEILHNEDPILIKMDVEGYEQEVVAGASATLKKASLNAIITETVDPTIRTILETRGFRPAAYQPFERSFASIQSGNATKSHNTLFICRERVGERLNTSPHRRVAGVVV